MNQRDETLCNFLEISGIEDVDVCREILEQNDWNIQSALNFTQDNSQGAATQPPQLSKNVDNSEQKFEEIFDTGTNTNTNRVDDVNAAGALKDTENDDDIAHNLLNKDIKQEEEEEEEFSNGINQDSCQKYSDDDGDSDTLLSSTDEAFDQDTSSSYFSDDDSDFGDDNLDVYTQRESNNSNIHNALMTDNPEMSNLECSRMFVEIFQQRQLSLMEEYKNLDVNSSSPTTSTTSINDTEAVDIYETIRWHIGTYSSATSRARNIGKLMFVYIHDSNDIQANIILQAVFGSPEIVNILNEHCVCWGWDITFQSNKQRLDSMSSNYMELYSVLSNTQCVMLLELIADHERSILYRNNGYEEVSVLADHIASAVDEYQSILKLQAEEYECRAQERILRDRMIDEQNMAYQKSLQVDRVKKKEKLEAEMKILHQDKLHQQELDRIENLRLEALSKLPSEPPVGVRENIVTIRFMFPDKEGYTDRRFYILQDCIRDVINYMVGQGYPDSEYDLVKNFPRAVFEKTESRKSLKEAKFGTREQLFIHEK